MGAQLDNSRNKKPISEINVTPFVDVVLVLLVIFMITAPMLFNRIELKLPKTKKVSMINFKKKQVILSVSLAGEYYIGEEKYLEEELTDRINYLFQRLNTHTLFLRADYSLPYGEIARLIANLKQEGISDIALVTEIES